MKKSLCILVCLVLFASLTCAAMPAQAAYDAEAAVLIETLTGEMISGESADKKLFPAALTKLMSFLIFFEAMKSGQVKGEDSVSVSPNAAAKGGTSVFLDVGTQYPFSQLLQAAIVSSGNDATVALAEHISGSEEAFTDKMNSRAAELSIEGRFADPTGLSKETSVSATELARIAAELSKHAEYFTYSSVWTYTFTHNSGRKTELTSSNKLIKSEGCDGMATGSSGEAGYCLAASSKNGKARFIAVVIGAKSSDERFRIARELLGMATAGYSVYEAAKKGAKVASAKLSGSKQKSVDLFASDDLALLIKKDQEKNITKALEIPELSAPINAGEAVGKLTVTLPDGSKRSIDLTVAEDIPVSSFISELNRIAGIWLFGVEA